MRLWDASFRMFAMASDCDSSWSSCRAGWGQRLHGACQDWANTKAAYRFFGNDRISEANILAGHFSSTRARFAAANDSPVLVLHDTTEFSYRHEDSASIGILNKIPAGHKGRSALYTNCGILMHSSLVITRDGLPLGLAGMKFWSGKKFQGG